jgi:hypothetical protein
MNPKAFIPVWLNHAGLSQSEFRVYCCLASRADTKTGIAWPKAETIARDCFMAKNTVWKSLRSLEEKKLIRKNGKRFADSNRYQVLVPIGANEIPVEASPIGANGIPIASDPIGANEIPPIGANEILLSAQMDSRECITNNSNQGKVTKGKFSPEGIQFADWFKSTLPETIKLSGNWKQSFAKSFDDLVRLDGRSSEKIYQVCRWARTDDFWKTNFLSPEKLRKRNRDGIQYFDVFLQKVDQAQSNTAGTVDTGYRKKNDYQTI